MRRLAAATLLSLCITATLPAISAAQDASSSRWCPTAAPSVAESGKGTLVVVVPGLDDDTDSWSSLIARLSTQAPLQKARWLCFDHGISAVSRIDLRQTVRGLAATIDAYWTLNGGYDKVIIAGHSAGATFALGAVLRDRGELAGEVAEKRPWVSKIERVVMLGGVTRGIQLEGFSARVATGVQRIFSLGSSGFVFQQLLRSAPFVTNIRLSWMRATTEKPIDYRFPVVQVLGERDDVVRREDCIDLQVLPNAVLRDLPGASHSDLISVDGTDNADVRIGVILSAMGAGVDASKSAPRSPDTVKSVVILMHGIRSGITGWQVAVRDSLASADTKVMQPNYGFFSASQFLSQGARQGYLGKLLEAYAEAVRDHPKAQIHIVAHSNGTYLVGEALRLIPAFKVRRVYLAGSVLPVDYDWDTIFERGQVERVVNTATSSDIPVGYLSQAASSLRVHGVGTAGVHGFLGTKTTFVYGIKGDHGAALDGPMPAIIRDYIRNNTTPCQPNTQGLTACGISQQSLRDLNSLQTHSRWAGAAMPVLAGGTLFYAGYTIWHGGDRPLREPDWRRAAGWYLGYRGARYLLSIF